jgi:hypothetical protein
MSVFTIDCRRKSRINQLHELQLLFPNEKARRSDRSPRSSVFLYFASMTQGIKLSGTARIDGQATARTFSVHRSKLRPFGGNLIFGENGFHGAFGYTCITIDTGLGVDHEHVIIDMKSINGANHCTIGVATIDAGLGDHIGHKRIILQL